MLIIFGGLPGTGKTTIAKALAKAVHATYLRIDTIETRIKQLGLEGEHAYKAGYDIAWNIAKDNLRLGNRVIADSVNPVEITRQAWQEVAITTNSPYIEIEIICSDKQTHRKRVEERKVDIEGLTQPSWKDVQQRDYHPWEHGSLCLDTSQLSIDACVKKILPLLSLQK